MTTTLSIQGARNLMLAAQGLLLPLEKVPSKADVLAAIRRMHLLQIDTIHVVARSPYLVLWSRLGDFLPDWLDELLAERRIFESWSHAYCFLPIEDYPLQRCRMEESLDSKSWPYKWAVNFYTERRDIVNRIRNHILANGPVRSAEFENKNRPTGGWWNWKEEKDALEAMLLLGDVMIARRQKFQRVYDLRENVLPEFASSTIPSRSELRQTLLLRSVQALGIAMSGWVSDYFRLPKTGITQQLDSLVASGQLLSASIEGIKSPAYVHPSHAGLLQDALRGTLVPRVVTLLSPFDPLVWDRNRASQLFNFDYQIECYTPAAKRKYGYFTLPILYKGALIGRLDPKAHRAQGILEVKSIHLEDGVQMTREMAGDLMKTIHRFGKWQGTPDIEISKTAPYDFSTLLKEMKVSTTAEMG